VFQTTAQAAILLALISATTAQAADSIPRDGEATVAYIFVDPRLSDGKRWMNTPRVSKDTHFYRLKGCEVRYAVGTDENILRAILDRDVKAITFIGEGGFGSGRKEGASASTLGQTLASQWREKVFAALREQLENERGMSPDQAAREASRMSKNFGLQNVSNYSCYSLVDKSIADLFVRPGGTYWGVPVRYSANILSVTYFLFGDTDYFLTEYRPKGPDAGDGADDAGSANTSGSSNASGAADDVAAGNGPALDGPATEWLRKVGEAVAEAERRNGTTNLIRKIPTPDIFKTP